MTALATRTCGRCGATADQVQIGLLVSEPAGWTYVTVGGLPECHKRLCPACARGVRELLATSPTEAERRKDAEREEAFRHGYEAGLAEPREMDQRTAEAIAGFVLADAELRGDRP